MQRTEALGALGEPAADRATVEVVDACGVQIVQQAEGWERFFCAVSNALVGNPLGNPVLRVEDRLGARARGPTLAAVVGAAEVYVGGRKLEPWRALPLHPSCEIKVVADGGPAYVSFSGLTAHAARVEAGIELLVRRIEEVEDVLARFVPRSLLQACLSGGESCERAIERVLRHLRYACAMAREGAKLVKVRVGELVYELWVKEVE